jgi:hypothetical protein
MFLVSDSSAAREARIRAFLAHDPSIAVVLGAIHVEWTLRRAILALGRSPNVVLHEQMRLCYGLDRYKELWHDQVVAPRLPLVVRRWADLRAAFRLRHRLVHGAATCGADYAAPRVAALLEAAADVRAHCLTRGVDLHARLPVRRKPRAGML